jgi:tetratricopeptide (TPR) repeat protein
MPVRHKSLGADSLKATNRLAEAVLLLRRALSIGEKSFGPDHPNVALRLNNLGLLLCATKRMAEAEPLLWRALAIHERSFGPDHPTTQTIRQSHAPFEPNWAI